MNTYFNIRYEFDKTEVHNAIAHQIASGRADYICVADGVILNTVNRNEAYKKVVNDGMFSICDSSYVPLYLRLIYGKKYEQYCGSDIFQDIISEKKYRMAFLGTNQCTLDALQQNLIKMNPAVKQMTFYELPFCKVEEFDAQQRRRRYRMDCLGRSQAGDIYVSAQASPQSRRIDCRRSCVQFLQWYKCPTCT